MIIDNLHSSLIALNLRNEDIMLYVSKKTHMRCEWAQQFCMQMHDVISLEGKLHEAVKSAVIGDGLNARSSLIEIFMIRKSQS